MKFDISTKYFSLPFKDSFKTGSHIYKSREGFIVKILSDGEVGYGEVSPLTGFSIESLKESSYAIESLKCAIKGIEFSKEGIFDELKYYLDKCPSAYFGIETALLDIFSKQENLSVAKYLNPNCKNKIKVNGIAGIHSIEDNFDSIKVKMGFNNFWEDIEYLDRITTEFGDRVKLRLDLNGAYDLPRAIRFCKEVEKFNVDYIEQPLSIKSLEDLAELRYHTYIPIALDESLNTFCSAKKIIEYQAADIFIVKPMVSGGFYKSKKIIDLGNQNNISSIISTSLETGIGRMACLHLAASNDIGEPCGLSTGDLFSKDLANPYNINSGIVRLSGLVGLGLEIND